MRRQVPNSIDLPYHVTARCPNREFFKVPMSEVWKVVEDYLFLVKEIYGIKIHAFVLMYNHFHLLLSTPNANLALAMNYFLRETSKELNRLSERINQNWGGPYHKSLISSFQYFMNAYKYVYRNPVRAGLCKNVEDYSYSTISGLCGNQKLFIPIELDTLLFTPNFDLNNLAWLNETPRVDDEDQVRVALRKSVFKYPRDEAGTISHLENFLI